MCIRGFTLLELSIVLVIIGLIVGGITAGRSLIRSSELQSIVRDAQKYETAINAFRGKYNVLPGDMPNATAYWGAQDADPTACLAINGTGTQTCNGDGDGSIYKDMGVEYLEGYLAWQHLQNAGMIEGDYTGSGDGGSPGYATPGVNAPASRISSVGFFTVHKNQLSGLAFSQTGSHTHVLTVGKSGTGMGMSLTAGPFATSEEAFSLDKKLDDGKPAYGRLMVWKSGQNSGCTTSDTEATAAYDLTQAGERCALIFQAGY